MVGLHHEGATKPDQDKDTEEWRCKKIQVTERNKNKGPFLPDVIQKDVAKMKKKEKGIAYFYFVHFLKERAKSKCTVLGWLAFCDWFALYECFGLSPSFLLHYPIRRQKVLTDPGWQSRHSFTHLCSHWERPVIKLLIAWRFLCVFTRPVTKKEVAVVSHSPPVDLSRVWYSLYFYIYLLSQGSTVDTIGHDHINK